MRLATRHVLPADPGFHELPAGELAHLRFGLVRLRAGEDLRLQTDDREALLVVIEAPAEVSVAAGGRELRLPPRHSVFSDGPAAVYAPPGESLRLRGPLLAGIFQARVPGHGAGPPANPAPEPYAILPEQVQTVRRGRDNFARSVRDILPAIRPAARLLAGETLNPAGNWSSSPPHKHDREAPGEEVCLEEVYLFRVQPRQGFGLQHSYHAGGPSSTFAVQDLDVVAIPAGYHPVVAAPGYELYYLWCLAGEERALRWRADPAHAWVEHA